MTIGNMVSRVSPLAAAVASALVLLPLAQQAQAVTFNWGEIEGSFDSTLTFGTSIRTEDRDWDLIGKSNQPAFNNSSQNWSGYDPAVNTKVPSNDVWDYPRGSYSTNGDNGNLAYDPGEAFSTQFKGVHELDLHSGDFGAFTRFTYFYDYAMENQDRAWSNPVTGERLDPCANSEASERVCKDFRFLDAYVYGTFTPGGKDLNVRLGRQVLNWGESTFIPHGLSELVPIDIARLRAPGAELREAYEPVGMLWGSLTLTENLSIEAFYQFEWQDSKLPPPGSYFSTNDFAGYGGEASTIQLGFASNPDQNLDFLTNRLNSLDALYQSVAGLTLDQVIGGLQAGAFDSATEAQLLGIYVASAAEQALRMEDAEPEDGGQYGAKFTWLVPALNSTEFGFYYANYHSRRPLISGEASNFNEDALIADLQSISADGVTNGNITDLNAFTKAQLSYPEDLQMYGVSFNTMIGDTSVAGEMVHRPDEPLQIDDVELLLAGVPEQIAQADSAVANPALGGISQLDVPAPGGWMTGYIESDTTQAQATVTHLFGPVLGASNLVGLVEVGGIWIHDMPSQDELRLNGPGTDRSGGFPVSQGLENAVQGGVESNPFPDDFAWGYRLQARMDYDNLIGSVTVSPRLFFSHDVSGITPDPLYVFTEGSMASGLGVGFDYLQRWQADLSYSAFWGGEGTTNRLSDRDFASFNIKYSF